MLDVNRKFLHPKVKSELLIGPANTQHDRTVNGKSMPLPVIGLKLWVLQFNNGIWHSYWNELSRWIYFCLQVFDSFEVESHQQCMYDRVIAYDGLTTDSPQLGRFCGSRKPLPIISTGSTLLLTFNADGSVQRKGFRAQHSTGTLYPLKCFM